MANSIEVNAASAEVSSQNDGSAANSGNATWQPPLALQRDAEPVRNAMPGRTVRRVVYAVPQEPVMSQPYVPPTSPDVDPDAARMAVILTQFMRGGAATPPPSAPPPSSPIPAPPAAPPSPMSFAPQGLSGSYPATVPAMAAEPAARENECSIHLLLSSGDVEEWYIHAAKRSEDSQGRGILIVVFSLGTKHRCPRKRYRFGQTYGILIPSLAIQGSYIAGLDFEFDQLHFSTFLEAVEEADPPVETPAADAGGGEPMVALQHVGEIDESWKSEES